MTGTGLHTDIAAAAYHADPAPYPSLSASVAGLLLDATPLHAWTAHPRLNQDHQAGDANAAMDLGSVAHELILGRGGGYMVCLEFDDWRTKKAKEARDAVLAEGRIPLLHKQFVAARAIHEAVERHLRASPACADFYDPGACSEVVALWQDGPAWCRAMIDRLTPALAVYDIKTTAAGLSDRALQARIASGYDLQAAFYLRGLAKLHPEAEGRLRWRWVFCEAEAPYAVRVIEADAVTLGVGARKAAAALALWNGCMASGVWPAYGDGVERLDYPGWAESRWAEREVADSRLNPPAAPRAPDTIIFGERRVALPPEAA